MEFIVKEKPKPVILGEDIIDVPNQLIDPLIKEIAFLSRPTKGTFELCPGFWIEYICKWEEDNYITIEDVELKSTHKNIKKLLELMNNSFDYDIKRNILCHIKFTKLNKRIKQVIKDCDKLAKKYKIDDSSFFECLLEKAEISNGKK